MRANRCTLRESSGKLLSSLLETPHCMPPACKGWRKGGDISSCQSTPGAIESRLQTAPGWWCRTVENNPYKVNVSSVYVHSIFHKYESDSGSGDSYTRENMGVATGSADFRISLEEEKIIAFTTPYTVPHSWNVCLWNSSCVQKYECHCRWLLRRGLCAGRAGLTANWLGRWLNFGGSTVKARGFATQAYRKLKPDGAKAPSSKQWL